MTGNSRPSDTTAAIYGARFGSRERQAKEEVWRELGRFFQDRYIPADARVLDVGSDVGYFIRNVNAAERWATDIRDMSAEMPSEIRFVQSDGLGLESVVPTDHFDVVFMSNYLEHLPSRESVIEQLRVAFQLVRPGGRVVVLQPNVALVGGAYWDFIDHRVALTDKSLTEAAELAGFETEEVVRRFLPYTVKGRLPASSSLVRLYLRLPFAWRLLGKQTLYVGKRDAEELGGARHGG